MPVCLKSGTIAKPLYKRIHTYGFMFVLWQSFKLCQRLKSTFLISCHSNPEDILFFQTDLKQNRTIYLFLFHVRNENEF